MYKACRDHVLDIGPKGLTTTRGSDSSAPTDRIARYGILDSTWADSCIFGVIDPQEAMERLIVCDGQPKRGFRKAIFSQEFKQCGVCCGDHSTHDNTVQLLYVCKICKAEDLKAHAEAEASKTSETPTAPNSRHPSAKHGLRLKKMDTEDGKR